jgi:DDE superfamily endonuclease
LPPPGRSAARLCAKLSQNLSLKPGKPIPRSARKLALYADNESVQPRPLILIRAEFVAFLADVVATQSANKEIHIIVENLSAHKTKRVVAFLAEHPNVTVHYTPTYSSWLNQVENWFSKIQRDIIARGVFAFKADLARKIMRYIRHYNKAAVPFPVEQPKYRQANTNKPFTFICYTALVTHARDRGHSGASPVSVGAISAGCYFAP